MGKDLSRRKFLERIGLGTAAGASLSLLKDVAAARPTDGGSASLPHSGANRRQSFDSGIRMRQPLPYVPRRRQGAGRR